MKVLFVFLDGVGIGPDDPDVNAFLRADLPVLRTMLGGSIPVLGSTPPRPVAVTGTSARAFGLDANLGMPGTPQSGTGQAALLTGESTAEMYGGHFGPWTPVRLRLLVEERSLLRRALEGGRSVAFANAYPRGWPGPRGSRRIAGPPLAARGAGVLDRHEEALGAGEAVSSEIVNDGWQRHLGHDWLPTVTAEEAGANLARIATLHELTLYAHYTTDTAGHERRMESAVEALERVDAFLGGVIAGLDSETLLLIASDHGNIEDVRAGHTRNPALGLVAHASGSAPPPSRRTERLEPGGRTGRPERPSDLRHVTDFVLGLLGVDAD